MEQRGMVRYLNPEGLPRNPAFTNAVAVEGPVRTIYVGGQNAVDEHGEVVGHGDVAAQTERALRNVATALAAAGAGLEHVIKWTVYLVHGHPALPGFAAFQRVWGDRGNPPTLTLVEVAALAHPDFLVEIDAVAVVPL